MSDTELLRQIADTQKRQGEDLAEIRKVLGGDITGKKGIVQSMADVLTELYDKKTGLVQRVSSIEMAKVRIIGGIAAVTCLVTVGWRAFIDWLTAHPK